VPLINGRYVDPARLRRNEERRRVQRERQALARRVREVLAAAGVPLAARQPVPEGLRGYRADARRLWGGFSVRAQRTYGVRVYYHGPVGRDVDELAPAEAALTAAGLAVERQDGYSGYVLRVKES